MEDSRNEVIKKLWFGKKPEEVLAKRFKIFILISIALIALSKYLYMIDLTIPNLETIIPTLVVMGSFSVFTRSRRLSKIKKYFGFIALASVFITDMVFWGFRPIYLFTWPGFILAWLIGKRSDFSFLDNTKEIMFGASLDTASSILFFDVFTAFGTWLFWHPMTLRSLVKVYMLQVPFTLYHLSSLIFVFPLVMTVKVLTRAEVPESLKTPRGIPQ